MARWYPRAIELTGFPHTSKLGKGCAEALVAGTDEMLDHTQGVVMTIASGVCTPQAESLCVPLQTDDRPMVIAPLLIRPITTERGEANGATVIEVGTSFHCIHFDDEAGESEQEVGLTAFNHAPLMLPAVPFEEALKRYLHAVLVEHTFVTDPGNGRRVDICDQLVPIAPAAASASKATDAHVQMDCGGAGDSLVLQEQFCKAYATNRTLSDPVQRCRCGVLLTADAAAGKSVVISQLAVSAARSFGDGGLIPVIIQLAELSRMLRTKPTSISCCWNVCDAFLRMTYGEASSRYLMLRQALIARRCLLLLDGLDEGGTEKQAIEQEIVNVLLPQARGHCRFEAVSRHGCMWQRQ